MALLAGHAQDALLERALRQIAHCIRTPSATHVGLYMTTQTQQEWRNAKAAIKTQTAFQEIIRSLLTALSLQPPCAMGVKQGFTSTKIKENGVVVLNAPHSVAWMKSKPKAAKRNTTVFAVSGHRPQRTS